MILPLLAFAPPVPPKVVGPPLIKYSDAKTKSLVRKALAAYQKPLRLMVTITRSGGINKLYFGATKVRQDEAWAFDGRVLTIHGKGVVKYGKAGGLQYAVNKVIGLRQPVDPLIRANVYGKNYMQEFLDGNTLVRGAGMVKMAGLRCKVLEAKSSKGRTKLLIREKDGLIIRSAVEIVSPSGALVSSTERVYTYQSLPKGTRFSVR